MSEKLKASIMRSPIIDRNGYSYMVHPITDGIPLMDPDVLDEVVDWMLSVCDFNCDRIIAPESMGIPLAVPLSMKLRIPYTVIRKRQYGIKGEIPVHYRTGYSDRSVYINGLRRGDRVVIVDDLLSTGGTMTALVGALKENGISVEDILVVFNKNPKIREFGERLGICVKRMLDISIEDGRVEITEP